MSSAIHGVAFAMNEKPYYLFYLRSGFTGTVKFSVGEGESLTECSYDVVNGYYHCKDYVIFEVDGIYSLTEVVSVSAVGAVGDEEINAFGKYSVENYIKGIDDSSDLPDYVSALYSYAYASKDYVESKGND